MMNEKMKEIADRYNEAFVYMFGEGGVLQGSMTDDNAKAAATATVIIQFEKAGGFSTGSKATPPAQDFKLSCPKCGNPTKTGTSASSGKKWERCDVCKVWVQPDRTTKPMEQRF
jgi:hypothetical protein